uniref:Uncharacterized protein n=1 Tax=Arundo donax TaxID=35708 RepID=A0A0A9A578_ARUDO
MLIIVAPQMMSTTPVQQRSHPHPHQRILGSFMEAGPSSKLLMPSSALSYIYCSGLSDSGRYVLIYFLSPQYTARIHSWYLLIVLCLVKR